MMDINKEEALINYIIGSLTVFKSKGEWSKSVQDRFFDFDIQDFIQTGLFWNQCDECEIEVRNTKSLVVNVHIHYRGKDHGHTEVIRCDGLENFNYVPHIMIQDITRVHKDDKDIKGRAMIDDIAEISKYMDDFLKEYRKEKVYWTLKTQREFIDKLSKRVNLMIRLLPEYDRIVLHYDVKQDAEIICMVYMSDPDDGPYRYTFKILNGDGTPLPNREGTTTW